MKLLGELRVFSIEDVAGAIARRFDDPPIRSIWMEGELLNFRPRPNQTFFDLRDRVGTGEWQLRASILSDRLAEMSVVPTDGTRVHVYGRIEFFRRRSTVQFRVERMVVAGEGLLIALIQELKATLEREGLTDPSRRRPLPRLPRTIGLITSGDGAAKGDFLRNLHARFPAVNVVVVHSLVQGDAAPRQIVRAIEHLNARADVEVIVLARGGGPLEDLMAFNSELVCRAVAASATPVVSAIGHDDDRPLTDLVADLRVSTPTKAAEAVVPQRTQELAGIEQLETRGSAAVTRRLTDARTALTRLEDRLVFGLRTRGTTAAARLQGLDDRLAPSLRNRLRRAEDRLQVARRDLDAAVTETLAQRRRALDRADDALTGRVALGLGRMVTRAETALGEAGRRLDLAAHAQLDRRRLALARAAGQHEILSPERTVGRGYVIVRDAATRRVRTSSAAVGAGDRLALQFRDGEREATAEEERR